MEDKAKSKLLNGLAWTACVLLAVTALGGVAGGEVLPGICALLAAALLFPPFAAPLKRAFVPGWMRITGVIFFVILVGVFAPRAPHSPEQSYNSPAPQAVSEPEAAAPKPRMSHEQAVKGYNECLLAKGREHVEYTSFDGGRSALSLMGECKAQLDAYLDDCIGGRTDHETDSNCTVSAGLLAGAALKLLNK